MAFGSTYPEATIIAPTYAGLIAIVERKVHVLDGTDHTWPGDWLEDLYFRPTRVTWNSDESPNSSEIILENTNVEDWEDFLNPTDQLRVVILSQEQAINTDGESVLRTQRRIIFRGFPATVLLSGSDTDQSITIGCMGYRYWANRITVSRQTVWGVDPSQIGNDLITDFPLIFNEGGRMNRATDRGTNGDGRAADDASYLFTWPALAKYTSAWEGHDFWTAGQALEYLFNRFEDPDATLGLTIDIPDSVMLELHEIRLPEVKVEGMSLSEAASKIFNAVGYHWCVVPDLNTGQWLLKSWKPGEGTGTYDVRFPAAGTDLSAMPTSHQTNRFDVTYDYNSIVNEYRGIGTMKRYEDDWALQAAWDASLESEGDEYYYRSGFGSTANPDWEANKNVWRRWAIDGAGLITGTFKNFLNFLGPFYLQRPRFLDDQALSVEDNDEGVRKPAEVFLHHDGTWKRMDGNVDVFSEGFADGIYLDGKQITVDGGIEGENLVDVMKLVDDVEVIAAVEGDLAIDEVREDATSKNKYFTRQKSLRLPDFHYEKRWASEYGGVEVLRDDTVKMQEFLDEKLEATQEPVLSVSITTPLLNYIFSPGTTIRKIAGREIDINSEVVTTDFMLDSEQSMQLSLADTRMRRST